MSSSGSRQSRKTAVFHERLKRIVANGIFRWFVGILIGIAGVIIALLTYMQGRVPVTENDVPKNPPPPPEHTVTQEYAVVEHRPLFVREARTNLSVLFQNIDGEEFVSLNISPAGKESSVRAVFKGYTEEFTSSVGVFNVQILDIDYGNRKVAVQVSRKI